MVADENSLQSIKLDQPTLSIANLQDIEGLEEVPVKSSFEDQLNKLQTENYLLMTEIKKLKEQPASKNPIDATNQRLNLDINKKLLTPVSGKDLSEGVIDYLNLLTIKDIDKNSKETAIVGSYKSKAMKYPGDIDMLEFHTYRADSLEDAQQQAVADFKEIAADIDRSQDVVMADFKCGFDIRFNRLMEMLGQPQREYALPDMVEYFEKNISGYNKREAALEIGKLLKTGVIDRATTEKLFANLPDDMTGESYLNISKILRKYRLLRWSLGELLTGIKVVPSKNGGHTHIVELKDAILHDTIIKLDAWAKVGLRWTEITNIYVLKYIDNKTGEEKPLGFSFKISIDEATEIDFKYYSSVEHEKPFKLAKRIWNRAFGIISHSVSENNDQIKINKEQFDPTQWHIMKKLYPLFSADTNKLSQIIADTELFIDALDKMHQLNLSYSFIYKELLDQIENIPESIFRIMLIKDDRDQVSLIQQKVSDIIRYVEEIAGTKYKNIDDNSWEVLMKNEIYRQELINKIESLQKMLKSVHDRYVKSYMIENNLHPRFPGSIVQFEYSFNYLNLPFPFKD